MGKAKMALAMMNPATQIKMKRVFDWVDAFIEAVKRTGIKLPEINEDQDPQEIIEDVGVPLLSKSKVRYLKEKNALILEMGKEKRVRLILSFKEVE